MAQSRSAPDWLAGWDGDMAHLPHDVTIMGVDGSVPSATVTTMVAPVDVEPPVPMAPHMRQLPRGPVANHHGGQPASLWGDVWPRLRNRILWMAAALALGAFIVLLIAHPLWAIMVIALALWGWRKRHGGQRRKRKRRHVQVGTISINL